MDDFMQWAMNSLDQHHTTPSLLPRTAVLWPPLATASAAVLVLVLVQLQQPSPRCGASRPRQAVAASET
jgi:hypothetical protein